MNKRKREEKKNPNQNPREGSVTFSSSTSGTINQYNTENLKNSLSVDKVSFCLHISSYREERETCLFYPK